ncbi:hypothetical protein [Teichococcus deserti]|nr:hypothetical protein [Pseudoroseomonas deserti]
MPALPDIADEEIKSRLEPLAERVLPKRQAAPPPRAKVVNAEFLMPETVKTELKVRAAQRGISASKLLLEILREAGLPVTDADLIDHRKLPRKS